MKKQLDKSKLCEFLKKYDIKPKEYKYYEIAFFHPDINHSKIKLNKCLKDDVEYLSKENQRFEYLGDSIYSFCINLYLFNLQINNKIFLTDKQMNNIKEYFISGKFQSKLAKDLNFYDLIISSEIKLNPSDEIYEDIFESFICAIYNDQGLEKTKQFINEIIFQNYPIIINANSCQLCFNNSNDFNNKELSSDEMKLEINQVEKLNGLISNFEKQPVQTLNIIYDFLKKIKNNPKKNIPRKELICYKNKSNLTILMVNGIEFQSGKNKKEAIINTIKIKKELLIETIYQNI